MTRKQLNRNIFYENIEIDMCKYLRSTLNVSIKSCFMTMFHTFCIYMLRYDVLGLHKFLSIYHDGHSNCLLVTINVDNDLIYALF